MAQVSDSTAGIQEAVRSLQPQNTQQSEQATQESNSQNQARQAEDKVVISPEAKTETRETRKPEGQERAEVNNRIKEEEQQ